MQLTPLLGITEVDLLTPKLVETMARMVDNLRIRMVRPKMVRIMDKDLEIRVAKVRDNNRIKVKVKASSRTVRLVKARDRDKMVKDRDKDRMVKDRDRMVKAKDKDRMVKVRDRDRMGKAKDKDRMVKAKDKDRMVKVRDRAEDHHLAETANMVRAEEPHQLMNNDMIPNKQKKVLL